MQDDDRCCGTGTCIIDPEGRCWCGQVWDGEKMCHPASASARGRPEAQDPVREVNSQADHPSHE